MFTGKIIQILKGGRQVLATGEVSGKTERNATKAIPAFISLIKTEDGNFAVKEIPAYPMFVGTSYVEFCKNASGITINSLAVGADIQFSGEIWKFKEKIKI